MDYSEAISYQKESDSTFKYFIKNKMPRPN